MRRSRRLLVEALVPGAALTLALVSNAVAVSRPLDRLELWDGQWNFQSETKETAFSHALTESGDAKCAWQPNHSYMICEYVVDKVHPDDGSRPDNLSILYYSNADKAYKRTFMSREGDPRENTMVVEGNTWTETYHVTRRSGGTADMRHILEFVSPGKQLIKTEVSIDKGAHWTEISQTVATKVS